MPASAQSASRLNCAAESGINRIVAMRAPPGLVILPGSQAGARPFLLHKSHLEKNNAALLPDGVKSHEVGGRKASSAVNFHRIGRLIRESLRLRPEGGGGMGVHGKPHARPFDNGPRGLTPCPS